MLASEMNSDDLKKEIKSMKKKAATTKKETKKVTKIHK